MEKNYVVIVRDFYREHPPILLRCFAANEGEAASKVLKQFDKYKEVLDVVLEGDLIWDKETIIKYWKRYSSDIDESEIETMEFKISVEWSVYSTVSIEAHSFEEALEIAKKTADDIPLPTDDVEYVEDSFRINDDFELTKHINS